MMSLHQHRYPRHSLATPPYRSSLLAGTQATTRILTELPYVGSRWSPCFSSAMYRGPWENITYELVRPCVGVHRRTSFMSSFGHVRGSIGEHHSFSRFLSNTNYFQIYFNLMSVNTPGQSGPRSNNKKMWFDTSWTGVWLLKADQCHTLEPLSFWEAGREESDAPAEDTVDVF